jgi:hypothetical protein
MSETTSAGAVGVNDVAPPPAHHEPDKKHKFNDDLLMQGKKEASNSSLAKLNSDYVDIAFAFDFEAFRTHFKTIDARANTWKIVSQWTGILALLCTGGSLWFAWIAPQRPSDITLHDMSIYATCLGVAGFLLGASGFVSFGPKGQWLRERLRTERMRQFFFQMAVMRLPELVAAAQGTEKDRGDYQARSNTLFNDLRAKRLDDPSAEMGYILAPKPRTDDDWLLGPVDAKTITAGVHQGAQSFYRLYQWLRLEHQAGYAAWRIKRFGGLWWQENFLSRVALGIIGVMFVLHLMGFMPRNEEAHGSSVEAAILAFALAALLVKVFEEGLQPQREVERYEDYLAHCEIAKQKFEAARVQGGPETFQTMLDFERIVYEEMKHFLRTHHRAHFLV